MIVALMQCEQVRKRGEKSSASYLDSLEQIGFGVYRVKDAASDKFGTSKKFAEADLTETFVSDPYLQAREISFR